MSPRAERKLAARDRLVLTHLGLVERIARKLRRTLPACFDTDDLTQAGMMGLLDAATHYDPIRFPGVPFGAFARCRIKGAIQDSIGLTNPDAAERTTRRNKWTENTRPPIAEHRYEPNHQADGERSQEFETPDPAARSDKMTERTEKRDQLNGLSGTLSPKQALVIELHYGAGEVDLLQISRHILHLCPSRVSQLHNEGLTKMRSQAKLRGQFKRAA